MKHGILAALISGILMTPGITVAQNDDTGLEHVVAEMADTPAEHEALARHYTALAAEARQDTRRHEQLASVYTHARRGANAQLSNHCRRLAAKYGEIAAEYDEIAKLHAQEARGGTQEGR